MKREKPYLDLIEFVGSGIIIPCETKCLMVGAKG